MRNSLKEYEYFIDGLVKRRNSVEARSVKKGVWHEEPPPDQAKYNSLLSDLSQEQRDLIADLLQQAREGGMHDFLVFLTDKKYQLSRNGIKLAWEPFGTPAFYDFVARLAGDQWPNDDNETDKTNVATIQE